MPYDVVKNIDGPKMNGFIGGMYYKNYKSQYVGYGNFSSGVCVAESPAPGFVLGRSSTTAGAYLACENADFREFVHKFKRLQSYWFPKSCSAKISFFHITFYQSIGSCSKFIKSWISEFPIDWKKPDLDRRLNQGTRGEKAILFNFLRWILVRLKSQNRSNIFSFCFRI